MQGLRAQFGGVWYAVKICFVLPCPALLKPFSVKGYSDIQDFGQRYQHMGLLPLGQN